MLLTQIYRDLQRVAAWYKPSEFVRNILSGLDEALIGELSGDITELVSHPDLFQMDEKTMEVCRRWDAFCHRLFHAYQDLALREVTESA